MDEISQKLDIPERINKMQSMPRSVRRAVSCLIVLLLIFAIFSSCSATTDTFTYDATGWTDPSDFIDSHRQLASSTPIVGDMNGDGTDTTGIYNTGTAEFTFGGKTVRFGQTNDEPIIGDWDGDGYDEIGVFRSSTSMFYLVTRNWAILPYDVGAADKDIPFSYPEDIPIAGDWDGDGDDDIGGYYPPGSSFYLYRLNLGSSTATSYVDVPFGQTGDTPITGDWDYDGDDDVGVHRDFDPEHGNDPTFYFDLDLTGGQADIGPHSYGNNGDIPIAGSWNGDSDDNIGVYRPSMEGFFLAYNIPPTLKYLDNGIIRVGVNFDWGGAISEIIHQDFNLIDDHDTGRLAQVAFYNSVWNPVQGGDKYNRGSPVLDYTVQHNQIYTRTQLIDWNTGEFTDVYVEQWISLENEAVKVNYKMAHFGTEVYTFHDQEFPCAYVNKDLYRCITYCGNNPWTYDTVVDLGIQPQPPGSPNTYFYPTEYWASFVNDLDFGLTLYSKDHTAKWAANRFNIDTQPGYLATVDHFTIEPGTVEEATEYFIVGNYPDARNKIYSLKPGECEGTDTSCGIYPNCENCNEKDGCYTYGNGCEERNYYCNSNDVGCDYTCSNRHTDYYDDWDYYCKGDEVWKHRLFHDFCCDGGSCTDHTSWEDDQLVENCNDHDDWYCNGNIREYRDYYCSGSSCTYTVTSSENCNNNDGWVDTGNMNWVDVNECLDKEQKEQEYLDYYCSGGFCFYSVANTQWIDTGNTRNKPDGTICGCTVNNTLKECYDGTCTDKGICNSTICGADVTCDGKKLGESCGVDRKCNSTCKCVKIQLCGDVTCDDVVDVSDVGRLLYYVGFPGDPRYTICNEWAADVTCDGAIDVSDVGRLLYHVGFPGDPRYTLNCCEVY